MSQEPQAESGAHSYARFAKRDLDKMSWLAPLVNNRAGDLLNIELRHEQLFFVQDGRVVEGATVGLSLLAGGVATILLSLKTRATGHL